MNRNIDVIISTNKNLISLKKLINQIISQKGNFLIKIIVIHQFNKKISLPNFLKKKNIIYKRKNIENLSLSKNDGINISKSNIITFLDDDVKIASNYFLKNWNFMRKNNCDILFSRINKFNTHKSFSKNMSNKDVKINYFNTSTCLSSTLWMKNNFDKNILFDKNFGLRAKFGSGEETDYIFRALYLKKKIYYSSNVGVYHPDEFFRLQNSYEIFKKFFSYGKGQGAIFKKNFKKKKIIFVYLILNSIFKSIVAFFLYSVLLNFKNMIKHSALLSGKIIGIIRY